MTSENDTILALALGLLTARAIMVLSLVGAYTLFMWAAYQPDPLRIVAASLFAVLVHIPIWLRSRKDGGQTE